MEPNYRRIRDGAVTTADDPERGVWYSSGCCYWTDDWSKLTGMPYGIPTCPECGAPGFQCTSKQWDKNARAYELADHPGYVEFLEPTKEKCNREAGLNMEDYYNEWRKGKGL